MAKSLQEQLMGAGLVDGKKAKALKQEKRKKKKQQGRTGVDTEEQATRERLERERLEKVERDKSLNQQKQAELKEREVLAQIKQLITLNKLSCDGDQAYQFVDGTKIKKLYVDEKTHEALAQGRLAIVSLDDSYSVVARVVAEKIAERGPETLIALAENSNDVIDEDDPYKDYQIPDDLMW